ncbi:hypothetical protein LTR15_006515 [Elasticomyces elasticus]|nr:hypothetical protein LTR15_006515 [Elasticomyces elasticus]
MAATKPKTILDLPPEIRNGIYEQAFATPQLWIFSAGVHSRILMKPSMPAIFNARQQIGQESLSIFFSSQKFLMSLARFEDLRLSQRGRVAMKHMTDITVREYPSECMGGLPFKLCARVEKGMLEVDCMPYPWPGCTCGIEEAVRCEATRRVEETEDNKRGLAYVAIECFRDDHLPYLGVRSAYDHVCEACGEGVQKYEIGGEWAVSGATATALMKARGAITADRELTDYSHLGARRKPDVKTPARFKPIPISAPKMASELTTANGVERKSFLDLPPEIRNTIYSLVFGCKFVSLIPEIRYDKNTSKKKRQMRLSPSMPGIVNSHRQITQEALAVFYHANKFCFSGAFFKELFSSAHGQIAKKHKRKIFFCSPSRHRACLVHYLDIEPCVPDGSIDMVWKEGLQGMCTYGLKQTLLEGATRRVNDSEGQIGLAYAVVECFHDESLSFLDIGARRRTERCGKCQGYTYL